MRLITDYTRQMHKAWFDSFVFATGQKWLNFKKSHGYLRDPSRIPCNTTLATYCLARWSDLTRSERQTSAFKIDLAYVVAAFAKPRYIVDGPGIEVATQIAWDELLYEGQVKRSDVSTHSRLERAMKCQDPSDPTSYEKYNEIIQSVGDCGVVGFDPYRPLFDSLKRASKRDPVSYKKFKKRVARIHEFSSLVFNRYLPA